MERKRRPAPIRLAFRLATGIGSIALLVALAACGESDPASPGIPGGGEEYVLDYDTFAAAVAPIFSARGCDAIGDCHGGGIRGTFALSPQSEKDARFDFEQASQQVDGASPADSRLLRKPLAEAAGGMPHGFEAFASTDDGDYQLILAWIQAGEFR